MQGINTAGENWISFNLLNLAPVSISAEDIYYSCIDKPLMPSQGYIFRNTHMCSLLNESTAYFGLSIIS